MVSRYDVTHITLRPGTQAQALTALKDSLAGMNALRACWYSEIGALNQILIICDAAQMDAAFAERLAQLSGNNPLGIGALIAAMTMNSYISFDFIAPLTAGEFGPYYEVRTYMLKPDGLQPTKELWRTCVPNRVKLSPLLAAMTAVTGPVSQFIHIWPYKSLDERTRVRAQAISDGVWPPPGGPNHMLTQQTDIYLPAPFSPLR